MAAENPTTISLSFEIVDDLIYNARAGDLDSLKSDISNLSQEHKCSTGAIIESAIDMEDESEGGTGSCLLHWPSANGNIEILKYLLDSLKAQQQQQASNNTSNATTASEQSQPKIPLLNHKNHSGNTPLHWAALNTHLDCVKALIEAGADINVKNTAGHDAAFLAERSGWSGEVVEPGTETDKGKEAEAEAGTEAEATAEATESESSRPVPKSMQVAEWILSHDKDTTGQEGGADTEGAVGASGS